ncbi:Fum1p [Penicillium cosmopolitanum]|uniref:Fum1p n=1 Tax=Penicillium cosmopolitanum TaxID=1131564 RepID=A0A9W9SKS0_9EURO|nr:Fum1p [Penicillium cosmopolitanum]KAJ5379544.1 Fum1p [Penicillium cosmopolitanum]
MSSLLLNQLEDSVTLDEAMEMSRTATTEPRNGQEFVEVVKETSLCKEADASNLGLNVAEAGTDNQSQMVSPIAICGMALRLPGGVSFPEEFWKFLIEKRDGLCEVPETRYDIDSFYNESKPHSIKTRKGYFLQEDPACFDADFFSISSREAGRMDPQQRQLLEVVWECLESAGEVKWRGKEVGCFVGVYGEDWLELASKDPQGIDRYHVLGTGQFALSNRISYEFDFQGPSMTLQTGCSSSMVGLHEACQAIYSGECSSAIVAGTNLIFAPTMTTTMSENMVLSPSGMCRTFDEKADGYGRGEAINAILIKPLDEAIRNNDPIRAVIRATSTNCDGKTSSITTPGSLSQERLIRKAYKKAHIDNISQTAFFECHGTGTTIGDTAEASVVAKLFGTDGTLLGSVKPNVGHSEGASGITSVIKAVLSLENRTIPPNIFFDSPNPNIPFKEANLHVPTSALSWPKERKERASVNCFGIGGANAHAVLDSRRSFFSGPSLIGEPIRRHPDGSRLLVISAKSADSLQQRIRGITNYASENPESLHDLAFTLSSRREHLKHRAFAVAVPNKPLDESKFQTGRTRSSKLIFVFTGQGAQWAGMGRDLIQQFDTFRDDIVEFERELQCLQNPPSWSLQDELSNSNSLVNRSELSQPLCTVIQIGLVNLLRRMGVRPSSVVGHSSGEIAAAYASGAITAKSALMIAYYRGKATTLCEGKGAMIAVGVGRRDVSAYLEENIVLACDNSPQSVTLSGDIDSIRQMSEKIKNKLPDVLCRQLKVNTAYHSRSMKSRSFHTLSQTLPCSLFFSTVTSQAVQDPKELDAAYWRRNLQSPVLFNDAVKSILADPENGQSFIEVGPHSALSGPLRQIFNASSLKTDPVYIPTLTRHADDARSQLLYTVGSAYLLGETVNFQETNGDGDTLTNLPSYPWQHTGRHWHQSRLATQWRKREFPHHEILGARVVESSNLEPSWRNLLHLEDVPWIWDHVLQGNVVFPAAGYVAMAGEAVLQLHPDVEDYSIKDLVLKSPLLLKDEQVTEIITTLRPVKINDLVDSEWFTFTIVARDGVDWTKHCQGQVRPHFDFPPATKDLKRRLRPVDSDQWYRALDRHGLSYGKTFQGLEDIAADPVELEADATVNNRVESCPSRYTLHPTLIDQCLQLMSVALTNGLSRRIDRLAIPAAIGDVYIGGNSSVMRAESQLGKSQIGSMTGNSILLSDDGKILLALNRAAFFTVPDNDLNDAKIPLTADLRWTPNIGLTPPDMWLPTPVASGPQVEAFKDFANISFLYILETADIISELSPWDSHMSRYKDWILSEASKIRHGHYAFFDQSKIWARAESKERRKIIKDLSSRWDIDGEYTGWPSCASAIFENCVELMNGTQSPLDLLMDEKRLERLYKSASTPGCWSEPIRLMGLENPKMRILEIGGGTGSYTRKVLEDLESSDGVHLYSKYVFTDISPGFTIAGQEEFGCKKNMEFKVLDISQKVEKQGFEPHSFDLVIASNVLHATPSLRESLQNVHQLLAATGKLILHELSPETRAINYAMGILPGWWIGANDNRIDMPYVSPDRWDFELRAAGLTGNETYGYDMEPPFHLNHTIISGIASEQQNKVVTLVTSSLPSPWIAEVTSRFRENGYLVNMSTLNEIPPDGEDLVFMLDLDESFVYNLDEPTFLLLQEFMLNMTGRGLWVTRSTQLSCQDPRYGLVHGFARTLRIERELDLSTFETDVCDDESAHALYRVFDKIKCSRGVEELDPDYEFSYQDRVTHVGRCHWSPPRENEGSVSSTDSETFIKLDVGTHGLLDTLHWSRVEETELADDEVEIEVRYVGLNFRDILVALGLVGDKKELGLEGSGIIRRIGSKVHEFTPGDRIVTFYPGMFQSRIVTAPAWCFKIPDSISLDQAATMPSVYATAIHSLIELCALKKGNTVLIHSACGGVGLASIQICQLIGAEVFATVGNDEKVDYLVNRFAIPRNRIFSSRSKEFQPQILCETDGRGVDIVLNSLAGELLHASWGCVAKRGKMIELGKRDFLTNGRLSMGAFSDNRTFFGVDILSLCKEDPEYIKDLCSKTMDWINDGKVEPIQPVKTFVATEIKEAFRYMQQGVHMGKILVELPSSSDNIDFARNLQHSSFSRQNSYLLVGGLGGLGRSISSWMVENGARYLVYLSRTAGESKEDQYFLEELRIQGVKPICVAGMCHVAPTLRVLQMSMALSDRTFSKMTFDEWRISLAPKVEGSFNLHNATLNQHLDFFVVFSSTGGICGNKGQANYAAANTFLDSFALYRRNLGLPCSSLVLGPVEDIGFVSRNTNILSLARSYGMHLLNESEVIRGLEIAIDRSRSNLTSPTILGLKKAKPTSDPHVRPLGNRDIRFSLYYNMEKVASAQVEGSSDRLRGLLVKLEQDPGLLDEHETQTIICGELANLVTQHMPNTQNLDDDEVSKIAIDSLMSIEIRGWWALSDISEV